MDGSLALAPSLLALEKLRGLEAEDKDSDGPLRVFRLGKQTSSARERDPVASTPLAHLSPHSSADRWTRNDAVLAFGNARRAVSRSGSRDRELRDSRGILVARPTPCA